MKWTLHFFEKAWFDWAVFYIHSSITALSCPVTLYHHYCLASPCHQLSIRFSNPPIVGSLWLQSLQSRSIRSYFIPFISISLIITLKHSNHWTKITTKNNHECIIHRTLGSVWCDVMVVSTCIIAMLYYGSDGMGWEDGWYWHCVVGKWSIIRPFRLAMVAFTHHWVGIISSISISIFIHRKYIFECTTIISIASCTAGFGVFDRSIVSLQCSDHLSRHSLQTTCWLFFSPSLLCSIALILLVFVFGTF